MIYQDKNGEAIAVGDVVKDGLGNIGPIEEFHWTDFGTAVSVKSSAFKHLVRNVVLVERLEPQATA